MSPTFRSLHNRNFRLFFVAGLVSNTGTWMQRVAQDWLVTSLTNNSGVALGVTTGLQFLPFLLFGLWGGVLADRFPKRRLLVWTQAALGAQALLLGLLAVTGVVAPWHVYVLAFTLGLVTVADTPARQSFIVEMVGRGDLPNAVGLNSASFNGARLVGPALAGVLIAVLGGTGPVFLLNGATFLATILALLFMREDLLRPSVPVARAAGQLRAGLRYVAGRPDLVLPLVVVFFVGTFGLNFQMTLALFAREVFRTGSASFGLLSTMFAVGTFAGALWAARRVGRPRLRLLVGAAVAFGVLEVLTGLMPTYWTFAALLVPTGVAALTLLTAANTTMQLGSAPSMRGRVMALYMMVFMGGTPLGAPAVGWVAESFGVRWSLLVGGAVSAVATLVAAAVVARRGGLEVRAALRPRPRLVLERPELLDQAQV